MGTIKYLVAIAFLWRGIAIAEIVQETKLDFSVGYRYFNNDLSESIESDYRDSGYTSLEAEYNLNFDQFSFDSQVFLNWDEKDDERQYYDVRNALLSYTAESWKLEAGRGILFWGVSETINVVNTLNQVDLAESVDGKAKVGQDMISLSFLGNTNTFDAYYFIGFEELEYPGRPRPSININEDASLFEDDEISNYAFRWQNSSDLGDISIGYFKGIRRDPLLVWSDAHVALIPLYVNTEYMTYEGVSFWRQAIIKVEGKLGRERKKNFNARNIGFEYPIYPESKWVQDVILIAEHTYDSRDESAESMGQNDIFLGARLNLGAIAQYNSRVIWGYDLDYGSKYLDISFVHRVTDFFRWELKVVQFIEIDDQDSRLYLIEDEDFAQLEMHFSF